MSTTVPTISEICSKYNITEVQFSKATHCTANDDEHYYIVESQTTDAEYQVKFNRHYGKLTCTCPAGQQAISCWHMRAALAAEEHHKAEQVARNKAEQAEIEATEDYQFEQCMIEFERSLEKFDQYTDEFLEIMRKAC